MISDFIALTPIECQSEDSKKFSLELPDIFNEDEDVMCQCGEVLVKKEDDGFWGVHAILHENFIPLSEGDTYQRDALIEAIVINLRMITDINYDMSDVFITDFKGEYKKSLYE